jgi:hypothetical protein
VEIDKPEKLKGKYFRPELYGMPPEKGIDYDKTGKQRHSAVEKKDFQSE